MNQEESIALFEKCEAARKKALDEGKDTAHEAAKAVWNAWAKELLAERKGLEEAGKWGIENGIGQNEETKSWLEKAAVDFSSLRFDVAEHNRDTSKKIGQINVNDNCVKSIFSQGSIINFSGYIFPGTASFIRTLFLSVIGFSKAQFSGKVSFYGTEFSSNASFNEVRFDGITDFSQVQFSDGAWFKEASFFDIAVFQNTHFLKTADFSKTKFSSYVSFQKVLFSGTAEFSQILFSGQVEFGQGQFYEDATFRETQFFGKVEFSESQFSGNAVFRDVQFFNETNFDKVKFSGETWFAYTKFLGETRFVQSDFYNISIFHYTKFLGSIRFMHSTFEKRVTFLEAHFEAYADFTAINVEGAFTTTKVKFENEVPNFNQANFNQSPRLDNVDVPIIPLFSSIFKKLNSNDAARFRSLRRLAIDAHDHERERLFFKGEMRCKRGTEEKWWMVKWWFSLIYDAVSDYGQAVLRPLLIWLAFIPALAWIYVWKATKPQVCSEYLGNSIYLALQNALIFMSANRRKELADAYNCFFDGGKLPEWLGVIGIGHTLISAILLFLILLGLRNMFKIH